MLIRVNRAHAVTVGYAAAAASYTTNFDTTENPISESGKWEKDGTSWQNVQTSGGLAYTPTFQAGYDDAYAFLTSSAGVFAANQEAWATVHKVGGYSPAGSHESEILLRGSDTATTFKAYECQLRHSGFPQIVYLDGEIGTFTDITAFTASTTPVDGDVLHAKCYDVTSPSVGVKIEMYLNDVLIADALHTIAGRILSGQPGIGFFMYSGATNTSFCWSSFTAQDIP